MQLINFDTSLPAVGQLLPYSQGHIRTRSHCQDTTDLGLCLCDSVREYRPRRFGDEMHGIVVTLSSREPRGVKVFLLCEYQFDSLYSP